jgi:hypothetical protein
MALLPQMMLRLRNKAMGKMRCKYWWVLISIIFLANKPVQLLITEDTRVLKSIWQVARKVAMKLVLDSGNSSMHIIIS